MMSRYFHAGTKGEKKNSFYSFLTAVDGDEWSVSRPGHALPPGRTPGTHWIGGWMGLRTSLNTGL
jgi:hypothetical protein